MVSRSYRINKNGGGFDPPGSNRIAIKLNCELPDSLNNSISEKLVQLISFLKNCRISFFNNFGD
jgi:hypothetical protein